MSSSPALPLPRSLPASPPAPSQFYPVAQAALLFLGAILLLFLAKPTLLRPLFPLGACALGFWIYKRNEAYYLSFVLWISMLAPLLRRLVDWRSSYQEQSVILLAPLLLTLLPAIHLRRRLARVNPVIRDACLLAFACIAFGAGIGLIKHPGVSVILATTTWTAPIVLCLFTASIRERAMLARVLTRTFLAGVSLMAVYGVYQFVVAPPWDAYWLRTVNEGISATAPSFGQPRPYAMRVWSTMNAPGPLSTMIAVGLMWLATVDTVGAIAATLCGYVVLLLTMSRSAWLQTAIGLVILLIGCHPRLPMKSFLALLLMVVMVALGLQTIPQAVEIKQRFATFTELKSDDSANERQEMYAYVSQLIASTPLGDGLDTTYQIHNYPLDSSLLFLFYMTGWLGAACYLLAFLRLLMAILRSLRSVSMAKVAASAIVLSSMTQITSGDVLFRQGGILLWMFVGVWASLEALDRPAISQEAYVLGHA